MTIHWETNDAETCELYRTGELAQAVDLIGSIETVVSETQSWNIECSNASRSAKSTVWISTPAAASADKIGVFVAHGNLGRTTMSCDRGRSWILNRDDGLEAPDFQCVGGNDCSHHQGTAVDIVFGNGWFARTIGWGKPGTLFRSRDGFGWEKTWSSGGAIEGLVFGNGYFLMISRGNVYKSTDLMEWQDLGRLPVFTNIRAIDFLPYGDGMFVIVQQNRGLYELIFASVDDVENLAPSEWRRTNYIEDPVRAERFPADNELIEACRDHAAAGVVLNNDNRMLMKSNRGTGSCYSDTVGATWVYNDVDLPVVSRPLWTGSEFWAWRGRSAAYKSTDAIEWQEYQMTPDGINASSAVAFGDGTFVGVHQSFQSWYENQRFLYSENGIDWHFVEEGAYVGGHQITGIVYAEIDQQISVCPD